MNALQVAVVNRLDRFTVHNAEFHPYMYADTNCCDSGTRMDILQDINDWLVGDAPEHIYWLQGKAGTGKSTISRSVVRNMVYQNRIVASFFFKRAGQLCIFHLQD
ncbi:hypothetical protein CDD80_2139 [Ophiocordyceps camponoti-rufipedis]|uniref:Nephrocystin 3-like N-terminal domain-containing protein n=1 Tax=Ophiocordyceps camponoti-rufipedis TaxID=2004952 RepID=A0A2C5YQB7_9HYPO|nr:hypothetical protein CDD80_2139 [Ophiocordyceps camponoti-rufipedis]